MPRNALTSSFRRVSGQFHTIRHLSQYFRVVEHTARCQHTRDRPAGAELSKESDLRLSVKQYVPKTNTEAHSDGVTLIGAHANAFPKEVYEPLWDDIYENLHAKGCNIRSIWIADQYNQGHSGVLNEEILGCDPSWWDHGRDLLSVINQFQNDIPHPIIGVGHSMGGTQLAHLSLMHPRLLDGLVLIDPVIQTKPNPGKIYAQASTYRRDLWPSRAEAAKKFSSSKFYQKWDSRVLQAWIEHGLRDLPTEQFPDVEQSADSSDTPVTLTTTKAQEVYHFQRPAYNEERMLDGLKRHEEMHAEDIDDFPLYRPEPAVMYRDLDRLRPSILYIFGETSELSTPPARRDKMNLTGTGIGGSGGKDKGRVEEVTIDCGHLVPMEETKACAAAVADFVDRKLMEYDEVMRRRKVIWEGFSRKGRVELNDKWREQLGGRPQRAGK